MKAARVGNGQESPGEVYVHEVPANKLLSLNNNIRLSQCNRNDSVFPLFLSNNINQCVKYVERPTRGS
jgi:hypothetical protein